MSAQMHHTPLDLARQHGHGTVVEVLESIGMKEVSDDEVSVLAHFLHVHEHVMLYWYTVAVRVLRFIKHVCNTCTCIIG